MKKGLKEINLATKSQAQSNIEILAEGIIAKI
jgi:hypothetical protein